MHTEIKNAYWDDFWGSLPSTARAGAALMKIFFLIRAAPALAGDFSQDFSQEIGKCRLTAIVAMQNDCMADFWEILSDTACAGAAATGWEHWSGVCMCTCTYIYIYLCMYVYVHIWIYLCI